MSGLKDKSWVRVVRAGRRLSEVVKLEPSRWLEFGWEWEILEFGWEEWEIGVSGSVGQMGVCSVLRVAAPPGGEKHLLTMQNRKQLRFKGSNQFSFEG